jgi:hypothetical protein
MAAGKVLLGVAGAVLMFGSAIVPQAASAASLDSKFRAAIQRLLLNLKDGPVAQMTTAEKKDLIACVNQIFSGIPPQKKQFILDAGSDFGELRARFDKVGSEDRAKLKQEVTRNCA